MQVAALDGVVGSPRHQSELKAAQEELFKNPVGINKEESDLFQQTLKVKQQVSFEKMPARSAGRKLCLALKLKKTE